MESPARAAERLRDAVGIEPSFQALGIDERSFLDARPEQALNAYEDQCAPADPRMPLHDIMRTAYYWGGQGRPDAHEGRTALVRGAPVRFQ
ncbi:hypothetical protein GCM10018966_052310 [Streptomyces yanii]